MASRMPWGSMRVVQAGIDRFAIALIVLACHLAVAAGAAPSGDLAPRGVLRRAGPEHGRGNALCNMRAICLRQPQTASSAIAFAPPPSWPEAYRTGPQLPLAFAAGEFLETQKNAMGDFFSETWARTKQGFSLLWTNWNAVREVQARRNKGETISLHEYCMIARDKKDTGKLIRAIGVYAMSPSLLPYYLIFWPGALPSTFDLPKHQEAKYLSHVAARVDGLLQGLMELERESTSEKNPVQAKEALALKTAGLKALSSPRWKDAAMTVQSWMYYNATAWQGKRPRANLEGLPPSLVKGAALSVGTGLAWMPAFILKFPLKSHLVSLIDGDEELAKPGLEKRVAELSRHDLLDMCLERGLGHPQWERVQLQASLQAYRKEAEDFETSLRSLRPSPEHEVDPFRMRLVLLALHTASSARQYTASLGASGALAKELKEGLVTVSS